MGRWKPMAVGKPFGDWKVIDSEPEIRKGYQPFFRCRCKCGKVAWVRGPNLRTGRSTGCGCSRKKKQIKRLLERRGVTIWRRGDQRKPARYESGEVIPVSPLPQKKFWMTQCLTCHRFRWYAKKEILAGHAPLCECLQPTYQSYKNALDRCYCKEDEHGYPSCGGRGVMMTKHWTRGYKNPIKVTQLHGFYVFLRQMGVRPYECQKIRDEQGRRIKHRVAEHTPECSRVDCELRTLDRVDPNGHYIEFNCQWSDRAEQLEHKRKTWDTPAVEPLIE